MTRNSLNETGVNFKRSLTGQNTRRHIDQELKGSYMSPLQLVSGSPPATNRGVQTPVRGNVEILMDWLSFTLPEHSVSEAQELVGGASGDWVECEVGAMGYRRQCARGNIRILSDGSSPGVHVVMSGQGCREWEGSSKWEWASLLRMVEMMGGHLTRCDVAVDVRGGVAMDDVIQAVRSGSAVTRYRSDPIIIESYSKLDGHPVSATVYYGSAQSDTRLRIYDKAAEQAVPGPWIRFELQWRRERARDLANTFRDKGGSGVVGLLRGMIEFKERGESPRRERWRMSEWWAMVVGAVDKIRIGREPVKRTVEQVKRWVKRQVAPVLAAVVESDGNELSWLIGALSNGRERWRSWHKLIAATKPAGLPTDDGEVWKAAGALLKDGVAVVG